jgi:hypothetical protein
MEDMYPDSIASPPLHVVFVVAQDFGLTEEEVWQTAGACLHEAGRDATETESMDELTAALARQILAKERSARAERRRAALDDR